MSADDNQCGVIPIFATPFASINTAADAELNQQLARICEQSCEETSDPLLMRSKADFLDTAGELAATFRQLIMDNAIGVIVGLNDFASEEINDLQVDARAWSAIVKPNGHIPAQHFPGASWLAVYCVQSGEVDEGFKNAGILRIHETRLSSIYRDASNWNTNTPYRYGHYSWSPQPGSMALFPAHVQHEISVVRSSTPLILVFVLMRFVSASGSDSRCG